MTVRREPGARPRASSRSTGSVTLNDVARLAGVSPITVSRVLNRPHQVNLLTREAVQRAVEQTGYVPNLLAGGLASRRSRLVAAIVPSLDNTLFTQTFEALNDRLRDAGYQVLLGLSGYDGSRHATVAAGRSAMAREEALLDAILSRRPDAICLTGVSHSAQTRRKLLAARIPIVETWDLTDQPIDMVVGFSHEQIGRTIGRYLLDKGYRQVGLLWADDDRASRRKKGLLDVLREAGVTDVPEWMMPAPSTFRAGREALCGYLSTFAKPQVVVCSSDATAHGAITEAASRGLAIPRDLAVMGFGDLDFAAGCWPPLSTINIDRPGIGRLAAEALLAKLEGHAPQEIVRDVGFHLIERQST